MFEWFLSADLKLTVVLLRVIEFFQALISYFDINPSFKQDKVFLFTICLLADLTGFVGKLESRYSFIPCLLKFFACCSTNNILTNDSTTTHLKQIYQFKHLLSLKSCILGSKHFYMMRWWSMPWIKLFEIMTLFIINIFFKNFSNFCIIS